MKKIFWSVVLTHLGIVCFLALWAPFKEPPKKPLKIRTISSIETMSPPLQTSSSSKTVHQQQIAREEPKPSIVIPMPPATQKTSVVDNSPKRVTQPPKGSAKKPKIPQHLLNQIQESIAKIEQNRHKEVPLSKKLSVPSSLFKIECLEYEEGNEFTTALIECFQKELHLPERGEVKVALTLRQDGSLAELKLLSQESEQNAQFLEKALRAMYFPSFKGDLAKQKEHTFVITFCSH